jgi:polyisoprenoid-binding protein YceI
MKAIRFITTNNNKMESTEVLTKTKWVIDPINSQIGFRVKYLLFSNVRGSFREFDASIYTKGNDFLSAEIDFWINPASIDTGNEQRDTHLRAGDFFDVEQFKEINFTANTIASSEKEGHYEIYGEFTMKGITKKIKLDVESGGIIKDPWGSEKALFSVNGKIDRKDWGLTWNTALETGGFLVSEEVWINCEVQLIKQA